MKPRIFLTQFFADDKGRMIPVCSAFGGEWLCPRFPLSPEGWSLVSMLSAPQQVEAAKQDPRVIPLTLSGTIPPQAVSTYASWGAKSGMNTQQLLDKLSETEPIYGNLG